MIDEALQATGIPTINLQRIFMRPESLEMHVSATGRNACAT